MEQIVHIIPLGWEYDRAVLPLENLKAHRIYVIVRTKGFPERAHYLAKLQAWARKSKVETRVVPIDSFRDLHSVMKSVSEIIVRELGEGNRVYVNVSTSGKVAAIGATLAGMAHLPPNRGMVYYVAALDYPTDREAQREHGLAKGMDGDPLPVPIFPLKLPSPDCQRVLSTLDRAPGGELAYTELLRSLGDGAFESFAAKPASGNEGRPERTRLQVTFNRRIVAKLVSDGSVTTVARGKNRSLRLTGAGRQLAALCV
ncbi:MAG: DUF6293 family protein [Thermoplasmata archaeon]|nr:DUF6293 family protein [Thermoplasmata archaeon]